MPADMASQCQGYSHTLHAVCHDCGQSEFSPENRVTSVSLSLCVHHSDSMCSEKSQLYKTRDEALLLLLTV